MRYWAFIFCAMPLALAAMPVNAGEVESGRCHLVPENGPCKALLERAYFDQGEQRCRTYYYDGCGPVVPYETIEQCKAECETGGSGDAVPASKAGESR